MEKEEEGEKIIVVVVALPIAICVLIFPSIRRVSERHTMKKKKYTSTTNVENIFDKETTKRAHINGTTLN